MSDRSSLVQRVQAALTDDLRRPPWRGDPNPLAGHCYVACEALYHLLGGAGAGYAAYYVKHEGQPHWFLRDASGAVIDPTVTQFKTTPPYDRARRRRFLPLGGREEPNAPSARARVIMRRLRGEIDAG